MRPSPCYLETTQRDSGITMGVRYMACVFVMDLADTFQTSTPALLFRAISLMDRYLSRCALASQDIVLLALACFSAACKVDETQQPSVRDMASAADNVASSDDIVAAEAALLHELNYQLVAPTAKVRQPPCPT